MLDDVVPDVGNALIVGGQDMKVWDACCFVGINVLRLNKMSDVEVTKELVDLSGENGLWMG